MKKGEYRHYKGKDYEVLDTALHSETLEKMVIYKALYKTEINKNSLWVRPLKMFEEEVEVNGQTVPRFRYIEEKKK